MKINRTDYTSSEQCHTTQIYLFTGGNILMKKFNARPWIHFLILLFLNINSINNEWIVHDIPEKKKNNTHIHMPKKPTTPPQYQELS